MARTVVAILAALLVAFAVGGAVAQLSSVSWSTPQVSGDAREARDGLIGQLVHDAVWVYGGNQKNGSDTSPVGWSGLFTADKRGEYTYYVLDTAGPALSLHSSVEYNDIIWMYGGFTAFSPAVTFNNRVYKWEVFRNGLQFSTQLTALVTNGGPAVSAHSASLVGSRMYVFGGCTETTPSNDVYVVDLSTQSGANSVTLTLVNTTGTKPAARCGHGAAAVGQYVFIWGGATSVLDDSQWAQFDDLWRLDTASGAWQLVTATGGFAQSDSFVVGATKLPGSNPNGDSLLIMYGGQLGATSPKSNSTFILATNGSTTAAFAAAVETDTASGKPATGRAYNRFVAIPRGSATVDFFLYGGETGNAFPDQTYVNTVNVLSYRGIKKSPAARLVVPALLALAGLIAALIY